MTSFSIITNFIEYFTLRIRYAFENISSYSQFFSFALSMLAVMMTVYTSWYGKKRDLEIKKIELSIALFIPKYTTIMCYLHRTLNSMKTKNTDFDFKTELYTSFEQIISLKPYIGRKKHLKLTEMLLDFFTTTVNINKLNGADKEMTDKQTEDLTGKIDTIDTFILKILFNKK